ncbi:helix-turn-helix transcriptional regulator [Sphingobacterium deserti]|uniref:Transcriptional regulator, AraC family n=1 Tax=Sphingobacterium deserti TaxID=1229276 RepID=A0A0B8T1G2_9SPHI|nr:AraC family transcriptional regulator [Sphingobacterium deserti]KGE14782.1 transcriptional regulator, AraC family [Sphingobacterium deserti]
MTGLENKHVDSEKYACELQTLAFSELQTRLQYVVLQAQEQLSIVFPAHGFLNILCGEQKTTLSYHIDSDSYAIESDQNVLQRISESQRLRIKNLPGRRQIIIVFIPQNSLPEWAVQADVMCRIADNSRLNLLKARVLDLHFTENIAKNIRIQSLLLDALALQLESLQHSYTSTIQTNLLEKIIQAQQLIEKDLAKSFTISELAKAVGTNEQYLKKYFKQHLGKTIMHYTLEAKMLYAKKLIMSGDYRIADIARMTGYKHATHFSMSFKKFFGILPTALRYILMVWPSSLIEFVEVELLVLVESSSILSYC